MEPTQSTSNNGRVFVILAFVFAALALLVFPIVFGPLAIVMAAVGMSKGDPLGRWALAAAIVGMIGGFVIGALVFNATSN